MTESRFTYIDGFTCPNAKRMLKYLFKSNYDRVEKNDVSRVFDIFLIKPKKESEIELMKEDIQDFIDYWGHQYKFHFTPNK